MPQKYFDAEGNEVEAFAVEEAQKIQEERDALAKDKEVLLEEKKRLEEGSADKDENFRKFRAAYEEKEKKYDEAVKRLNEKEEYERKTIKDSLRSHYAGADEEAQKRFDEEYAIINIEENTPENISKRAEKAARMSGLYKEETAENPIFKGIWGGAAPNLKPIKKDGEGENVVNTDKGKSALAAMGIPVEENK